MAMPREFRNAEEARRFKEIFASMASAFNDVAPHAPTTPITRAISTAGGDATNVPYDTFAFPCADDAYDHAAAAKMQLSAKNGVPSGERPPIPVPTGPMSPADVLMSMPGSTFIPWSEIEGEEKKAKKTKKTVLPPPLEAPKAVYAYRFGASETTWTCVFSEEVVRTALLAHPLAKQRLFIEPATHNHAFRIGDSPGGQGKALFATRTIPRDEVIVREPPLLVTTKVFTLEFMTRLDEHFEETMHARALAAYDALYDCWPKETGGWRRRGTIRTNGFFVAMPGTDESCSAIFEILSRANHSCDPTFSFKWDLNTFQGTLTAKRHVRAGEEITVSYMSYMGTTAVRREELQRKYNFKCKCKRCGPD